MTSSVFLCTGMTTILMVAQDPPSFLPSFLRRSLIIETLAWLSLIRLAYLSNPPAAGSLSQQSKSLRSYFNLIRSSVIDLPGMAFPTFSSLDTHILIMGFLCHPSSVSLLPSLEPCILNYDPLFYPVGYIHNPRAQRLGLTLISSDTQ